MWPNHRLCTVPPQCPASLRNSPLSPFCDFPLSAHIPRPFLFPLLTFSRSHFSPSLFSLYKPRSPLSWTPVQLTLESLSYCRSLNKICPASFHKCLQLLFFDSSKITPFTSLPRPTRASHSPSLQTAHPRLPWHHLAPAPLT